MNAYQMPAGAGFSEVVVKKSRFLGFALPVSTEEQAQAQLACLKKEHWNAHHHCSAYILGPDRQKQKYSDDGEPQGTAGLPLLQCLEQRSLTNVSLVVVRYFGGVLLGANGLVRAYRQAGSQALDQAGVVYYQPVIRFELSFTYAGWAKMERFLPKQPCQIEQTEFGAEVRCVGICPCSQWERFHQNLLSALDGALELLSTQQAMAPWPVS